MTQFAASLAFGFFYIIYYFVPLGIVVIILEYNNIKINIKDNIGPIIGIILILLAGFRTNIARKAYGERDMKFFEAHKYSWYELKNYLTFLPIIGKYFNKKKD